MNRAAASRAPLLLIATALAGCQMPAPRVESNLQAAPEILAANPSDIAILPIEDATPDQTARPRLGVVRGALAKALIQRRYAPLQPSAVDAAIQARDAAAGSILDPAWIESVAGKAAEDALLLVRINRWDESSLMSTARVRFDADVKLVFAKDRSILWSGNIRGEAKAGGADGPAPFDRQGRARGAAEQFASELIRRLPARIASGS